MVTPAEALKSSLAVCPECGGEGQTQDRSKIPLLCHRCYGHGVIFTAKPGERCVELLEALGYNVRSAAKLSAA